MAEHITQIRARRTSDIHQTATEAARNSKVIHPFSFGYFLNLAIFIEHFQRRIGNLMTHCAKIWFRQYSDHLRYNNR